jgi:two-component system, OmpR family, alkaline phosphatase synthesis response regulator PhoP
MKEKLHKTILIVEDDKSLLNALVDKFTREGFDVLKADNGKEGLDIALDKGPDLILLDILLPIMDGLNVLKKLREESDWGKKVPIILLTNVSADTDEINKTVEEYEPAYYLVKSDLELDEVVEKVKECIE